MFKTEINGIKVTISSYGDGSFEDLKKLGLNGEVFRDFSTCVCCPMIRVIGAIYNGEFHPIPVDPKDVVYPEYKVWEDEQKQRIQSMEPVEDLGLEIRLRDHRLRHTISIWSYYGRFDRGTGSRAFVKKMLGRTVRRMNRQMIREQF